MGSSEDSQRASKGKRSSGSHRKRSGIQVEDAGVKRPFMRGIVIHSLMARGISYEEAYRCAERLRAGFGSRSVVQKSEIAKSLREMLGEEAFLEDPVAALPAAITVTGRGPGVPFSKGRLSQSLLAAALDPNDAFDVARAIERQLLLRGTTKVDRRELRRMAYETLKHDWSERAAQRYLVWRKYQDPERPVIILLGGAAGVGKTSLALEVAHRLGIGRVLSTDSIRQVMRLMLSAELMPALHASSYDAYETLPRETLGDDPVIEGFLRQASTVSVGVRGSLDRAILENTSLVIDGVSLAPGIIDLSGYVERAEVIFLNIATLDESALEARFASRAAGAVERPPHRYLSHLDDILRIQNHLLDLADRYDVPIVDNISFDRSVLQIIKHVTETLRKKGHFDVDELL